MSGQRRVARVRASMRMAIAVAVAPVALLVAAAQAMACRAARLSLVPLLVALLGLAAPAGAQFTPYAFVSGEPGVYSWTPPPVADDTRDVRGSLEFTVIGGGGGGGGGATTGGGGGGSGAMETGEVRLPWSGRPPVCTIRVGAGGNGGREATKSGVLYYYGAGSGGLGGSSYLECAVAESDDSTARVSVAFAEGGGGGGPGRESTLGGSGGVGGFGGELGGVDGGAAPRFTCVPVFGVFAGILRTAGGRGGALSSDDGGEWESGRGGFGGPGGCWPFRPSAGGRGSAGLVSVRYFRDHTFDSDIDDDGLWNSDDNCPDVANANQFDGDRDGQGDACDDFDDRDSDSDGLPNELDHCPLWRGGDLDTDGDGRGDDCDPDQDNDGVFNPSDTCPKHHNPGEAQWLDADGDGSPDACDADYDGDGVPDALDNCPAAWNPDLADADGDGTGDACQADGPPTTVHDIAPLAWHTQAVPVTLTASHPRLGIASTSYRLVGIIDDGNQHTVTHPIERGPPGPVQTRLLIEGEGEHVLEFLSVDRAGTFETTLNPVTVRIDTRSPQTSDDADSGWHGTDQTVHLRASDPGADAGPPTGSGVDTLHHRLDGGGLFAPRTDAASVFVEAAPDHSNDGVHTIEYWSVDVAGNEETHHSATVRIDTTASSSQASSPAYSNTPAASIAVHYTAADPNGPGHSGLAKVELWAQGPGDAGYQHVADNTDGAGSGSFVYLPSQGDGGYRFYTVSEDAIGNREAAPASADTTTVIDTLAPTTQISVPGAGGSYTAGTWNAGCGTPGGEICGTAADAGASASGVQTVQISIRASDGSYWNGSAFSAPSEVFVTATGTTSWSYPFPAQSFAGDGGYTVHARSSDAAANTGAPHSATFTVDVGPKVNAGGGPTATYSGNEGSAIALSGTVSSDAQTQSWSYTSGTGGDTGATCRFGSPTSLSTTFTCTDNGTYQVTLTASDAINPPATSTATVKVANVAPSVKITSPSSGTWTLVGVSLRISASFTDPATNDKHPTCLVNRGDGTTVAGTVTESGGSGKCTASVKFPAKGTYWVSVTATDDNGGPGTSPQIAVNVN